MMTYETKINKTKVTLACLTFKKRGWYFEYSSSDKCWDILTPAGWRVAKDARDLIDVMNGGPGAT